MTTAPLREPLVLLHGWGCDARAWQPLLDHLATSFECIPLQLPGYGSEPVLADADADAWLQARLAELPPRFALLGWSLGGVLATRLAAAAPERVRALVTLASNPCFVARDDWPHAMPEAVFDAFEEGFASAPEVTLQRFAGLMARGDRHQRELLKPLRRSVLEAYGDGAQWQQSLAWLRQLDSRPAYARLRQPGLHLLGGEDDLVPAALAGDLRHLNPDQAVEIVPALGHALHWSRPALLADRIGGFLRRAEYAVAKRRIAESFGKAAPRYDSVAELQRRVGGTLLARVRPAPGATCLDLGSGTGWFTPLLGQRFGEVIGLDLAEGMLRYARERHGRDFPWVCGDAERLPLADASVDCVFSAMAIQWCADLEGLFAGLARIRRPGGRIYLATLGPGTLAELRSAWAAVDGYEHVNRFASAGQLRSAIEASGLQVQAWHSEDIVWRYDELRQLTYELKTLGAHNMNRGQGSGLTSRQRVAAFRQAYEGFRDANGKLPATWEVFYLQLGD